MPRVSVLMPTFKQARFIQRAIESLLAQSLTDWELLILDDGSPDDTYAVVEHYHGDDRVSYVRWETNRGLGAALNAGLQHANSLYVAYLPSDDVYYANHLSSLVNLLDHEEGAILAYAGVRHHYNQTAVGQIDGEALQLVQVVHRRVPERWLERSEFVTDDLERMYWGRLRARGHFVGSEQMSCEWVDHPDQRHKRLREPAGGINPYRVYYGVREPLRFHTSTGNYIDEVEHYRRFRTRPPSPLASDALKIVLVGELAYNPERVLAFEERGHKLYGLWMPDPYWYNTVGPLPFGHVEDLPRSDWSDALRAIKPDVIYALLNWQAVPFAHQVMIENADIPFVWHFKEGPFICLEKGTWNQLIELYLCSDGQIYSSPEMRDWFGTVVPGLASRKAAFVLDGDLPKRDWFDVPRSQRLSERDGEVHTVVPGRPIGLHPHTVAELAAQGIHLHFYGDFTHGQWATWIEKTKRLAPDHLHLHRQIDQEHWVAEFSQYDAGWLHFVRSENGGEIRRSNWDDLNVPARMATLAVAGLPMLQYDNAGSIVATQSLSRQLDIGIFGTGIEQLAVRLRDEAQMARLRENVWRQREQFIFDTHVDRLIAFFRQTIASRGT